MTFEKQNGWLAETVLYPRMTRIDQPLVNVQAEPPTSTLLDELGGLDCTCVLRDDCSNVI